MSEYPKAMLADLKKSGLGPKDAAALGLEYSDGDGRPCYAIPYPALDGKATEHYRVRYLGATDKLERDAKGRPRRYTQPKGSAPRFYYPRIGGVDWKKVAADARVLLYMTEGEKKAAASSALGVPTVGLGGVFNWLTDGQAIDDFDDFAWKGRAVRIAFDSDIRHKADVRRALTRLADELIKRGAIPSEIVLPELPGGKTGVDDFLAHHGSGTKALARFCALPELPLLVPTGATFAELAIKKLPAPRWAIKGLVPVGLSILAGKPKIGKSWLTLDLSLAVASGGKALGLYDSERGGVLHLALEDRERQFQDRLKRALDGAPAPDNARFFNNWPAVANHGLTALRRLLDQHPGTRLVVIDTLAKMRARPTANGSIYHEDYDAIGQLKAIADEYSLAVVVVHHERKGAADDHLDRVSGSTGLTGAADTILTLGRERGQMDAVLSVTGRDVEEQELALSMDPRTMRWACRGDAADFRMSQERRQIIEAFTALGRAALPSEVADLIGKKRGAIKKLMLAMAHQGQLRWTPDGKYVLGEKKND
jgi:hypothetical protein